MNENGFTALIAAALGNRTDAARLLLNAKADPNARYKDGHTALFFAIQNNNNELVQLIHQAGGKE